MKIEQEMTKKYSYDNWDKFKCDENTDLLVLEKKFDPFSIDKGYNYASNMALNKNVLVKEISSFNDYFKSMTKDINLTKVETLKEKSKVYYLFYFMSRAFFYVIMNNNFMFTKENGKVFSEFFIDYKKIIETCKLYLNQDLLLNSKNAEDNNMIIEKTEKENNNINNNDINKSIYESFQCLKKYQNEFKDAIISCQNFLIVILFSGETVEKPLL